MPDYMDAMLGISGSGEDEQEELAKRLRSQNQLANVMSMSGHERARDYGGSLRKGVKSAAKGHVSGRKERRGIEEFDRKERRGIEEYDRNMELQKRRVDYEKERMDLAAKKRDRVDLYNKDTKDVSAYYSDDYGRVFDTAGNEVDSSKLRGLPKSTSGGAGGVQDRFDRTQVRKLSETLDKKGVANLDALVGDITDTINVDTDWSSGEPSLDGVGGIANTAIGRKIAQSGAKGQDLGNKIDKFVVAYLASVSGATVTEQEARRTVKALATAVYNDDKDFLASWNTFLRHHDAMIRNKFTGFDQKTRDAYHANAEAIGAPTSTAKAFGGGRSVGKRPTDGAGGGDLFPDESQVRIAELREIGAERTDEEDEEYEKYLEGQ